MNHFIVEIVYKASPERIAEIVDEHRAFLSEGYNSGMLLMSGPKTPKTGGVVVARADTMENVAAYFEKDPYKINDAAEYHYIQFTPVKHQDFLKDWI